MNTHQHWVDVLRIIATCMVIVLHLCVRPLINPELAGDVNWNLAVILRNITTVSVPLFFMISGYLYLNKKEIIIKDFLFKRFISVILPFLIWSYIWLLYRHFTADIPFTANMVFAPFVGETQYHLWFMYPLIVLYLAAPLLHKMCHQMNDHMAIYALILWLGFAGIFGYKVHFHLFEFKFKPEMMTPLVGYFIGGYLIARFQFFPKRIAFLALLIYIFMIIGTFMMTADKTALFPGFFETTILHVMVLTLCIFWLCHYYREKITHKKSVRTLSELCFFVYMIHPLYIFMMDEYVFNSDTVLSNAYLPVSTIVVITASFATAAMARTLKLNKILG